MKRKVISIVVGVILLLGMMAIPAQADDEEQMEEAIAKGVAWLASAQGGPGPGNGDGSWGESEKVGHTGLAVVKLEDRAFELGYESPFDPEYPYHQNVIDGLNYIFSQAGESECCLNDGLVFDEGAHETYSTGIAMMAIAASRAPDRVVDVAGSVVDGMTYADVLQGNVDYFVCAQNPDGGWRYICKDEPSDQSNTGYAVLGLSYAEGLGITIPQSITDNLSRYVDAMQDDSGGTDDGGSWYTNVTPWVNLLKTGNLIFEMTFCGDEPTDDRFQDAIDYIERHWQDPDDGCVLSIPNSYHGWGYNCNPASYQAMYCLMKGLGYSNIPLLDLDGNGEPEHDWLQEFADVIVAQQIDIPDTDLGYWEGCCWGSRVTCTAWALLTLEFVFPDITPPEVSCDEDVNPHGQNVPGEKAKGGGKGNNPDGFYVLTATDNRDPEPEIWVGTTCEDGMLFGPYPSGTVIKFTEAPGAAPSEKKIGSDQGQAGAVMYHITLPSDPVIKAVDDDGNWSECATCLVPPPPK